MRQLVAFILIVVLAGCAQTPRTPPPTGATAIGSYSLAGKHIPLPSGKWTVIASTTDWSGTGIVPPEYNIPIHRVLLANPEATPSFVSVLGNVEPYPNGWILPPFCKRKNWLQTIIIKNEFQGPKSCRFVAQFNLNARRSWLAKAITNWAKSNSLNIPDVVYNAVIVGYYLSDGGDFSRISYVFDPEKQGSLPPIPSNSRGSDGHANRIGNERNKVAYIDKLIKWGADWQSNIDAGFTGK